MKKISYLILALSFFIAIYSCNRYAVVTFQPDQSNFNACPNPIYIATMSKSSEKIISIDGDSIEVADFNNNQESMTLVSILNDARKKYGEDVTIHNVRWDIKNGKTKIGVVYDVIKCK